MAQKKHIRFDWAVKKILRDKKNFDILEGFLSELLREDIKIEGILESESNQEKENEKFNRVDLFAENSKGEHIIIEIQNTSELDYLMRMLFGVSKAITDHLEVGKPYSDIKKVIAVSIIYFGLGKGDDYIYVGQTKFKGLHSKKELLLSKAQQELLKQPTIQQAYPEYYLIQTTKFKNVINEPLDEWIYFFKNSEVLDDFKAKGMKEVREKMKIHNLPDNIRRQYDRFLDDLHTEASIADTIRIEQEELTRKKVAEAVEAAKAAMSSFVEEAEAKVEEAEAKVEEAKVQIAKAEEEVAKLKTEMIAAEKRKANENAVQLIEMGLLNDQIKKITGLTDEEIDRLRKDTTPS